MKKILVFMLVLAMLMVGLTACSTKEAEEKAAEVKEEVTETVEEAKEEATETVEEAKDEAAETVEEAK